MRTAMDTRKFSQTLRSVPSTCKVLYTSLSPERVILFWVLIFISAALLFSALISFNSRFLISIPAYGGSVREGIIGTPRFINPVLATSEQDEDMTSLVYAGLTKKDNVGNTVLDMAESVVESEDGLHYTATLKDNLRFHDGSRVTVDDIIYTINLVQNPNIKSPHRIEWEGVTMEKISDLEMRFSLKRPYPLFMDTLTIGILPKEVWKNLSDEQFGLSDYNIYAVGSGPYMIDEIRSQSGIPHTFTLSAHENYSLGRPYVDEIEVVTYSSERYATQALADGDITRLHGMSPEALQELNIAKSSIHTSLLPQTLTIFFNPNKAPILSEKKMRQALQMAINKEAIVENVRHGYGKVINSPYPFDTETASSTYSREQAKELLNETKAYKSGGDNLELTLVTANTGEMRNVAEMIKSDWEALGIKVTLAIYEVADLNQQVIKDRDFQVLLFGSITKTPSDLYAFWHSSQRTYPGLNISNYVSNQLDNNLETLRTNSDTLARAAAYDEVRQEFEDEVPGIFLFSPSLIYIATDKATARLPEVSYGNSSRFTLVHTWYRYSERVWPKTYYKDIRETIENIIH